MGTITKKQEFEKRFQKIEKKQVGGKERKQLERK